MTKHNQQSGKKINKATFNEKQTTTKNTNQQNIIKMTVSKHLSIRTLNISGQNSLIKIHKLTEWTEKQNPPVFGLQEIHFSFKIRSTLK